MTIERWLRGRRVVTAQGIVPAAVGIGAGRIVAIAPFDDPASGGLPIEEAGDSVLLPGLVDTHVHVNEPGRSDWEGFATATAAAAAGGITTLVDMPLNSIPATTTVAALAAKRAAAAGRLRVDTGFWGGVVPANVGDLAPLVDSGVLGFKAFLVDSGVAEFPAIGLDELAVAAAEIAALGSVLLVHAELPELLVPPPDDVDRRSHAAWEASRPPRAEGEAVAALARIARSTGAAIHVVHLSSRAGLAELRAARHARLPLSGESCPHYLTFASATIARGATAWKCAPPIRGADEREALWRALGDGTLALVASDHSPSPPAGKAVESGDFFAAWGGIASLELSLSATWTAARARGFGLERIADWMAQAPARLAGIDERKGAIAVGRDADLVLFDPDATLRVDATALHHRHPICPYDGLALDGRVRGTWLRGERIFDDGRLVGEPRGKMIRR